MDTDEGGTLDRDEIRDLARSLGNQLTDAQLDQAMIEMDEDGSGEVDFEEFFDWYATCASHFRGFAL
jgi:calmodulin